MAIAPFAKKKLISKWNKTPISRWRRMNLHVAVSEQESLYSMFSNSNSSCSHFYVAKDGTIEQYIDTKYRSAADMNGNDSTISVETQGGVKNPDSEPWTAAQVKSLIKLWAWARDTHKIKNQVAKNTQTNDNSAGLSWHRLGVEGNFASRKGILSLSYKPGGIKYSSARGKICPGDAKILQIPKIWEAANSPVKDSPAPPKTNVKPVTSKPVESKEKHVTAVKTIKTRLKKTGHYKGALNSVDDTSFRNAVKAYQKGQVFNKLYSDGVWGSKTESHFAFTIRLQTAMNKWKSSTSNLVVDGDFGGVTSRKVKDLQARNRAGAYAKAGGRVIDGLPGPIFCKMLGIKSL